MTELTDATDADTTGFDYRAFEISRYVTDDGIEILLTHPDLEYDVSLKTGEEWACDPEVGQFTANLFTDDEVLDYGLLEDEAAVTEADR